MICCAVHAAGLFRNVDVDDLSTPVTEQDQSEEYAAGEGTVKKSIDTSVAT